jgi:hypothetical protein
MVEENGAFRSPHELAELLEGIGLRLHAKNRIAGESGYLWHLAEVIRGAGRLAGRFDAEPEIRGLFGDGYSAGTVPLAEQRDQFVRLLTEACGTT